MRPLSQGGGGASHHWYRLSHRATTLAIGKQSHGTVCMDQGKFDVRW